PLLVSETAGPEASRIPAQPVPRGYEHHERNQRHRLKTSVEPQPSDQGAAQQGSHRLPHRGGCPRYSETQLFSRFARRLQRKGRGSDVGKAKTGGHYRKRNQERYETGTIDLKKKHRDAQANSEQNHPA